VKLWLGQRGDQQLSVSLGRILPPQLFNGLFTQFLSWQLYNHLLVTSTKVPAIKLLWCLHACPANKALQNCYMPIPSRCVHTGSLPATPPPSQSASITGCLDCNMFDKKDFHYYKIQIHCVRVKADDWDDNTTHNEVGKAFLPDK